MHEITNLTNSPQDLESAKGLVRLPAMGSVTAEFTPEYLQSLRGAGMYEVRETKRSDPFDHDRDGRKGGAASPAELATEEDIAAAVELLDPANDDHWTAAGLPAVEAVREIAGKDVTRAAISAAAPDAKRPE